MRLSEVVRLLDCEVIWGDHLAEEIAVELCYAADLMSDVLAYSHPRALLVTGLASIQSAHTADVADLAAIVLVASKRPSKAVIDLAASRDIPLLVTPLSLFDACGVLHRSGLRTAHRNNGDESPRVARGHPPPLEECGEPPEVRDRTT